MNCPSCGQANAPDRVECTECETLLVDVFDSSGETNEKTDPLLGFGTAPFAQFEESGSDSGDGFTRPPADMQYSGDLPRLFRFGNRYQVLEKLGEGGMGRVYKALDLELDRPIALKTIRTEKGKGPEVLKRFKQELVLARKITHKNVVRIYDLGEAEGMKFFTMELVEGESLRDVLREKKTIPVKEAISYMKQMLAGLSEAHGQGVIHRDLKPQNVMVDREGILRIMDFGIARTADTATLTGSGEMMGTPDYISPEQVKGDNANAASDLYSAGIILYELLTGDVPFKGDTAISKVVARLQTKPPLPRMLNPEIPGYLERIILKLMEVDPDLRYRTAEEVLQDIEREQVDSSFVLRTRKAIARRRGWIAAAILAGAAMTGFRYYREATQPVASADVPVTTLAILPFHNLTGSSELAWMQYGIPEMLITDISQLRALRPVLGDRMERILRELGKADQSRFDDQTVQVISESAAADYSLYGSFVESQGRLRMDLLLRESDTGVASPIKIDGAAADVFHLVDEITSRVSKELDLDSFGDTDRPFTEVSTDSLAAIRAYYQARSERQKGANQAAIPLLQEAIAQDSDFAMAHAVLAETYFLLGDEASAAAAIAKAEALAQESALPLAERYQIHAISARIEDDPETAVTSYRELAKLFPNDPAILQSLASSLETFGVVGESIQAYQRVIAISPGHGAALLGLGRMMVVNGQPQEAIPRLKEAVESGYFGDDFEALGMIHSILGVAHRDMAQYDAAIDDLEKSLDYRRQAGDTRGVVTSLSNLADALRRVGRNEEARHHLNDALGLAKDTSNKTMESVALLNLGNLESDAGNFDKALERYRRSLDIELELSEHTEMAFRLDSIAEVLRKKGLLGDATVYLDLARVHLEDAEDPIEKAFNLRVRAAIGRSWGDYDSAQAALLEALRTLQHASAHSRLAETHLLLSSLYSAQARFDEALQAVGTAEELYERQPDRNSAQLHLARAEIYVDAADAQRALEEIASSDGRFDTLKYYDRLRLRLLRARASRLVGDAGGTLDELEALLRAARETELLEIGLAAGIELGWVRLSRGQKGAAREVLTQVYEQSRELRLRPIQAEACLALVHSYQDEGKVDEARRYASELIELAQRFQGQVLIAEGNHLVAEMAQAEGQLDEAEARREKAREAGNQVLAKVPPELIEAFLRRYAWVQAR